MSRKKDKKAVLRCPVCGCKIIIKPDLKVKRFPKTHFFKFSCGFAWLYNKKTEKVFVDVDWRCSKTKDNIYKPDEKELVKMSKRFFKITKGGKNK